MRPRERRESGQRDLFRARLDQIVDLKHPLAKLADVIDWGFLEKTFGAVYADGPGRPPLELSPIFGDGLIGQAALADCNLTDLTTTSRPSVNFTPRMSFGN
jgi:hypothetical protein